MIDLKGKCALVTGGSAGLGAEIARQLAAEGVNVAINYASNSKRAEDLATSLAGKFSVKTAVFKCDVSDMSAVAQLVDDTAKHFGQLDILISNAGWTEMIPMTDLDFDPAVWDKVFQINVKAHFYLFKAAKPYFEKNKDGGSFVASASVAGLVTTGSSLPYGVSKAALIKMIRSLAKTNGPKCRINAVCPGLLLTEWGQSLGEDRIAFALKNSPLGTSTDIPECALQYITFCKSSTQTGVIATVDAGATIP